MLFLPKLGVNVIFKVQNLVPEHNDIIFQRSQLNLRTIIDNVDLTREFSPRNVITFFLRGVGNS